MQAGPCRCPAPLVLRSCKHQAVTHLGAGITGWPLLQPPKEVPGGELCPLSALLSFLFTELPGSLMVSPCLARTPRSRGHVGSPTWMGRAAVSGASRGSLPRCEHTRGGNALPLLGRSPTAAFSRTPLPAASLSPHSWFLDVTSSLLVHRPSVLYVPCLGWNVI